MKAKETPIRGATGTNWTKEKVNDRKAEAKHNKDFFIEEIKQLQFSLCLVREEISFQWCSSGSSGKGGIISPVSKILSP